jgi:hypothetical protein
VGRKNKGVRRLALVLPALQRLGAGGTGELLSVLLDVLKASIVAEQPRDPEIFRRQRRGQQGAVHALILKASARASGGARVHGLQWCAMARSVKLA